MNKHIAIKDFRDMLLELNSRVWLEKSTVIPILKGMADLPRTDIVRCGECKNRKKNKFCLEYMRYEKNDEGFCSYGERIEE